ncbi:MAG TPA: hypothetical protein PLK37_09735 [Terricaulis sp.]|mgnify:CR=1 FL=1|nr:hypothetical protein [Terricaulis sp.]
MTWFGNVSAWLALAMGAMFAAGAALQISQAGVWPTLDMLAGALLLTGWFRTWRKMSGGLRLLAGAWGVAAGLLLSAAPAISHGAWYGAEIGRALGFAALLGLALTVLHKESK